MNLFQLGDFTLNSGRKSRWKLECDALTDKDIFCLAYMIRAVVGEYYTVEGVPQGGLKLAEALLQYRSPSEYHLIVDDVLTTGNSMVKALAKWKDRPVKGAVVFARGQCPDWIKPVFQIPKQLWNA